MKCAEYIDILEQIIYEKFKNDSTKDNWYTGRTKMEKNIIFREGFKQSIFYCCVTVQCLNCHHILSEILITGNNVLVQ